LASADISLLKWNNATLCGPNGTIFCELFGNSLNEQTFMKAIKKSLISY